MVISPGGSAPVNGAEHARMTRPRGLQNRNGHDGAGGLQKRRISGATRWRDPSRPRVAAPRDEFTLHRRGRDTELPHHDAYDARSDR